MKVLVRPSGGGPKMPECDTPPANLPPDFTPVAIRALGSAGLLNGGWKLTVWGIQSLAVFHVTVWPALMVTVSGWNRLTAVILSLHPDTTAAPLVTVAGVGVAMPAAWAFTSPSSLSA